MLDRPLTRRDLLGSVARGVAGLAATLVVTLAVAVDRFGQVDSARRAQAVVVLGARVEPDGRPSTTLQLRVEHAARLWREGVAPVLLFSGGVGEAGVAEAEVAARAAQALGVPAGACVVEAASHDTAQNARFSARILRAHGWTDVVVTSDPYHLLRARQLFRREGLEVETSPALLAQRHRFWPARVLWTLREVAALLRSPDLLVRSRVRADGG